MMTLTATFNLGPDIDEVLGTLHLLRMSGQFPQHSFAVMADAHPTDPLHHLVQLVAGTNFRFREPMELQPLDVAHLIEAGVSTLEIGSANGGFHALIVPSEDICKIAVKGSVHVMDAFKPGGEYFYIESVIMPNNYPPGENIQTALRTAFYRYRDNRRGHLEVIQELIGWEVDSK